MLSLKFALTNQYIAACDRYYQEQTIRTPYVWLEMENLGMDFFFYNFFINLMLNFPLPFLKGHINRRLIYFCAKSRMSLSSLTLFLNCMPACWFETSLQNFEVNISAAKTWNILGFGLFFKFNDQGRLSPETNNQKSEKTTHEWSQIKRC